MYWLPKMHQTQVGARFIVVLKNCSAKPLFDAISKVLKFIFNHVQSFHKKFHFTHALKTFGM